MDSRAISVLITEVHLSVVRRMRAVAVLGGIWAIAWAGAGIGLVTCAFLLSHPHFVIPLAYWTHAAVDVARVFGVFGFAVKAGVLGAAP